MLFSTNASRVCVLYAVSPLHAGAGQSTGAVDLPIQRERHTSWPMIQSSGLKGAFRDWFTRYYANNKAVEVGYESAHSQAKELACRVFGREESPDGLEGHAGAISITDGRLLAFPVRSNAAPFVWVTAPYVLTRLARDLRLIPDAGLTLPGMELGSAPGSGEGMLIRGDIAAENGLVLEDLVVKIVESKTDAVALKAAFEALAPQVARLVLISDADFTYLVRNATEVQAQIAINPETGVTTPGSLRYQELLPADSALYTLVFFTTERTQNQPQPVEFIADLTMTALATHVQIGGDMTLGRGLMEVRWLPGGKA